MTISIIESGSDHCSTLACLLHVLILLIFLASLFPSTFVEKFPSLSSASLILFSEVLILLFTASRAELNSYVALCFFHILFHCNLIPVFFKKISDCSFQMDIFSSFRGNLPSSIQLRLPKHSIPITYFLRKKFPWILFNSLNQLHY